MSQSERLLDLLQTLRRHRAPVTGQSLAAELGVSLRTVYRDIATLQGQGANIAGEAGIGYVLRPGWPTRRRVAASTALSSAAIRWTPPTPSSSSRSSPTDLEFGRSFVATEPDGHRIRVYALAD